MSLNIKLLFGAFDQVRHKPACSFTQTNGSIETYAIETTLPPTPNWSPEIFTLVQKVKIGHKKVHASINKPRL